MASTARLPDRKNLQRPAMARARAAKHPETPPNFGPQERMSVLRHIQFAPDMLVLAKGLDYFFNVASSGTKLSVSEIDGILKAVKAAPLPELHQKARLIVEEAVKHGAELTVFQEGLLKQLNENPLLRRISGVARQSRDVLAGLLPFHLFKSRT
ncbi:MAG TPA: hypothetical protein VHB73_07420 [Alphaproteobacteria bacterium]|nr:hypothetical protein [Alphaproteobacteria bacterium]